MEQILALDIGGTNTRIALAQISEGSPIIRKKEVFRTNEIKDLAILMKKYETERACIGFAGPISGDKAELTNANLKIERSKLEKHSGIKQISIINDFHANACGIKFVDKKDFLVLNKGIKNNCVKMIIGPGTGLGKAYVIDDKSYPCEGGLTTLGIENIEEFALLEFLNQKYYGPIYYEDIVSGRGLVDIYDYLEIKSNFEINFKIRKKIREEPLLKAQLITKFSSQNKLCSSTLEIFTKFYARFARDSALSPISSEVYLVGGISNSIMPFLKKFFMQEFTRHRKYSGLLKSTHVSLIQNEDLGLIGAAAYGAKLA